MIREAEAIVRKQRFLLCRYALIFVTGAVGLLETAGQLAGAHRRAGDRWPCSRISSSAPSRPFSFFDATMQAPILVTDTAMVSAVLLLARASQEFFLFFFFILIMAAKIENLVALVVRRGTDRAHQPAVHRHQRGPAQPAAHARSVPARHRAVLRLRRAAGTHRPDDAARRCQAGQAGCAGPRQYVKRET